MITKATQQKTRYRYHGTSAVEAAIVFPLLLVLTFGVIEYGWMFLKAHQITNAAREGSRIAVRPNVTNAQVVAKITNLMASAGITGYQVTTSPIDISFVSMGEPVEVGVSVPWENVAIINMPLLPKPASIQASTTMTKEGI